VGARYALSLSSFFNPLIGDHFCAQEMMSGAPGQPTFVIAGFVDMFPSSAPPTSMTPAHTAQQA
jgi:hypothetical protein